MKIYTASKLRHAPMWMDLANLWNHHEFTGKWPWLHVGQGVPDNDPSWAQRFWIEDENGVRNCDVVLVYAEGNDNLRGALVEAGMGIALGKRIIVAGQSTDYGTWQYHPLVSRVPDLQAALILINYWSTL